MIDPEDTDLAADLVKLGKILERGGGDIITELATADRTHSLAGVLEEAARSLRQRASRMAPAVIDIGAAPLSETRAAALLLLSHLGQQLPEICRRGYVGQVEDGELVLLSKVLHAAGQACREAVVAKPDERPPASGPPNGYPDALR